jgi:hypothetical protein
MISVVFVLKLASIHDGVTTHSGPFLDQFVQECAAPSIRLDEISAASAAASTRC